MKPKPHTGPINSLALPWKGERWRCTDCGMAGDDRDDLPHPSCPKGPGKNAPHLGIQFEVFGWQGVQIATP